MRTVSSNFKREVFKPQTKEAFIVLLKLEHADLEDAIRVTPDPLQELEPRVFGVQSNGQNFYAMPFEITLPGEDEESSPVSRVAMDNISREITNAIRQISTPPDATITVVLASNPDVEEISITGFQLTNIIVDPLTVEGELTLERTDLRKFPSARFTPSYFRALH